MFEFDVPGMSCQHCERAVTEALHQADPQAQVQVSLAHKTVRVRSGQPQAVLAAALKEAGYEVAGVRAA
jgi:copper chaperone